MILAMAGGGLLGYVGGQYWFMYRAQHQLQVQWKDRALSRDASTSWRGRMPGAADPPPVLSPGNQDAFARISIPKIHLDAVVVEGTSSKDLSAGPGHIAETALPGESGNAVITAHRDTYFRHIPELNQGDEIIVQRDGQVFRYQVTGKKIVRPEDVSVLHATTDAELTLITCYPVYYVGPAPERLVVFSKLVP
jgi:sortase A